MFLMLSYTRTAMVALLVGLLLGVLSLLSTSRRARAMLSRAAPGRAAHRAARRPAGRHLVQARPGPGPVRHADRPDQGVGPRVPASRATPGPMLFGVGLTDKSIDGLPIDSGFLAVYHEEGRLGVVVVVTLLVALVGATVFAPPGPRRAVALFLVTYCIVASYTETGIGDMSSYILSLLVAASLVWGSHGHAVTPHEAEALARCASWSCTTGTARRRRAARTASSTRRSPSSASGWPRRRALRGGQRRHRVVRPARNGPRCALKVVWAADAKRDLAAAIDRFAPRRRAPAQHVPAAQPVGAGRDRRGRRAGGGDAAQLPARSAPGGTLFRDGAVCHDCLGRSPLAGRAPRLLPGLVAADGAERRVDRGQHRPLAAGRRAASWCCRRPSASSSPRPASPAIAWW